MAGTSVEADIDGLHAGVHVVVGMPMRVHQLLRCGALQAQAIRILVLDEADEMLSRGYKGLIYDIFQLLPPHLQVRAAVPQIPWGLLPDALQSPLPNVLPMLEARLSRGT